MAKIHGNMGAEFDVSGDEVVSPLVVKSSDGTTAVEVERDGDVVFNDDVDFNGTVTFGSTELTATGAELNILDGVEATADEINQLDNADTIVKVVKVPLAQRADAGVLASWQNTEESSAVIVTRVLLDVTTAGGTATTADVGIAATAVTADTLLDGVNINTQALYDSNDHGLDSGANAKAQKCTDDYFVTVFSADAASAIVGNLYIFYVVV